MTGYVQAFKKLGFTLKDPRNSVSAESANGVAVAIYRAELGQDMSFDTRTVPNWDETRGQLPGNKERVRHLERALTEFDGSVRVVLVDGEPGKPSKTGEPWDKPDTYWQVTFFDRPSGNFRLELRQDYGNGLYPNPSKLAKTEAELWDVLEEQLDYLKTVFYGTPVQQWDDVGRPETMWEPGWVIGTHAKSGLKGRDDFFKKGRELLPYIVDAVRKRKLTPEFMQKWGMMMYYHGYTASYILDGSGNIAQVRGGRKVSEWSHVRKKFVAKHLLPLLDQGLSHGDAETEVAARFRRIIKGKQWKGTKFDHKWFAPLLIDGRLPTTYDKDHFFQDEMRALCAEPNDDIPPLTLGLP
jgi:hypothetical protein